MPLLLIESPNKIKKLKKILGSNYEIMATVGHIMDLSKKNMGINPDTFEADYKLNYDKKDIVKSIKNEAKNHEIIYIAMDPDREGEAIAHHILNYLPKKNVKIHRVLFNSITKDAVEKAIKNPLKLNTNLYNAQQARRITDRLVGFRVSPVMWTKGLRGTSAGRVQSVALKTIADREKSIRSFVPEEYWDIFVDTKLKFSADFWGEGGASKKVGSKKEADVITGAMNKEKPSLVVSEFSKKSRTRKPAPPFTTSTMQQAASNSFGWSSKKTMQVAQNLFGAGLITYHRTDSTRTDPQKIKEVRDSIENKFGKKYLSPSINSYGPKNGAQDAHEAIRPTYESPLNQPTSDEKRLLKLISNRFMASQMANASFDQVFVKFEAKCKKSTYNFKKNGSTMVFDGFLKVYGSIKDDVILPSMSIGDKIEWEKIVSSQHFTKPPNRYSDASIVKHLEREGVGRPSTYASIIDTLLNRDYVNRKGKSLAATDIGIIVSDYLSENFKYIVDAKFTSMMESKLDKIADGNDDMLNVLSKFNADLDAQIDGAVKSPKTSSLVVDHECLKCSSKMTKKISKHGAFLGCLKWPKCDGTMTIDGKKSESSVETGHTCPKCSNILMKRGGKNGDFYGCKAYPLCKFTAAIGDNDEPVERKSSSSEDTGVSCKKCKKGTMLKRNGRYGVFYGCSSYPKCKNILKKI